MELIILIAVIILQHIHISKHQAVHLKYIQILFVNYTSRKRKQTKTVYLKKNCILRSRILQKHKLGGINAMV